MTRYFTLKSPLTGPSNVAECRNICAGNRYCTAPVSKIMSVTSYQYGSGVDLRWPVCDKHAKPFHFKHLGAKNIIFIDIEDQDIKSNWKELTGA